jgi:hypothetical protein
MSTSPEYRQKCVALAERLEDCLRGQPANLVTHALALTLVSMALRWEDPDEALIVVRERAADLLHKAPEVPSPGRWCW